jgi:hypothetical protein
LEVNTVSRRRKRQSRRQVRRPVYENAAYQIEDIWVDISGRRMFVVGYTAGGAPYGVFDDEMDADLSGPGLDGSDQRY